MCPFIPQAHQQQHGHSSSDSSDIEGAEASRSGRPKPPVVAISMNIDFKGPATANASAAHHGSSSSSSDGPAGDFNPELRSAVAAAGVSSVHMPHHQREGAELMSAMMAVKEEAVLPKLGESSMHHHQIRRLLGAYASADAYIAVCIVCLVCQCQAAWGIC